MRLIHIELIICSTNIVDKAKFIESLSTLLAERIISSIWINRMTQQNLFGDGSFMKIGAGKVVLLLWP